MLLLAVNKLFNTQYQVRMKKHIRPRACATYLALNYLFTLASEIYQEYSTSST